ncbi:MAG TPA: hypothetical protein ENN23_09435 [Deltaproteobacteria bacterium]|nr:hypothetical protein [Deltaproteobacteria bacterium]
MKKTLLLKILLRSFFIHAALNFRRMQNMGFAFSIIPLIRAWEMGKKDAGAMLARHLQMYNSHPYFSGPLLGSVVRMEEEKKGAGDAYDVLSFKKGLMGPYAAIGDYFFWGALRPFAGIVAVVLAFKGLIIAPFAFLLIYTPAHLLVRLKGFFEGYTRGKQGIEFIRGLNLPRATAITRWLSVVILAVFTVWLSYSEYSLFVNAPDIFMAVGAIGIVMFSYFLIKKVLSQIYIIYGAVGLFFILVYVREIIS